MKKLYSTMLVLCVMGLLILSSGVALGIKGPINLNNATNYNTSDTANMPNDTTSATVTGTPIDTSQPTETTTAQTTETITSQPTVAETTVVPTLPKETPKSPGFEIVLTIGALSMIYIFGKFGKRR